MSVSATTTIEGKTCKLTRTPLRCLVAVAVVLIFVGLTGCASTPRANRTVRVAVLDLMIGYPVAEDGEVQDQGWWLSARDRYFSPNPGVQMGEALARELNRVPGVTVISREDLSIYMSQKERLLKRNYPNMTEKVRRELLLRQDPMDYGRSLNVDYIVTGEIVTASTVTNRTFSWWYSHVDARIDIYEVATGTRISSIPWKRSGAFDSQLVLVERCARYVARMVEQGDVFSVQRQIIITPTITDSEPPLEAEPSTTTAVEAIPTE